MLMKEARLSCVVGTLCATLLLVVSRRRARVIFDSSSCLRYNHFATWQPSQMAF